MNGAPWYYWPFEAVWWPFRGLAPEPALGLFSALVGAAILVIYRATVPGRRVREINEEMVGTLYEMWFVGRRLGGMVSAIGRLAWLNIAKIAVIWKPLVLLTALVVYVLLGLGAWVESRPLRPEESAVVTVRADNGAIAGAWTLEAARGLIVDTPPVRAMEGREMSWRVTAKAPGAAAAVAGAGGQSIPVHVSREDRLIRTGVAGQGGHRATVTYPVRAWTAAGFPMGWVWVFTVYALVGAMAAAVVPAAPCYGCARRGSRVTGDRAASSPS